MPAWFRATAGAQVAQCRALLIMSISIIMSLIMTLLVFQCAALVVADAAAARVVAAAAAAPAVASVAAVALAAATAPISASHLLWFGLH